MFFAAADLLNLSVDILPFDTTSTYFETEQEDALRQRGHSKDHRSDLLQIVAGLAVTKEGIGVRCWTPPGEANDQTVIDEVQARLRGWRHGGVITVVDRGISSDDTLATLRRAGGHWIAGERLRDGRADHEAALSRPSRYQQVSGNLRVKEVAVEGSPDRRWIVCHNPSEAERDAARPQQTPARLDAELAAIDAQRQRTARRKPGKKKTEEEAGHTRAECALRDNPALGRYLRQLKSGRLRIDRGKVNREARLDGTYLISTSDPDLTAAEAAVAYRNLLEAERGFRDLKSTLELRPVFHWLAHRIRAHGLICWLALLLTRVAERYIPYVLLDVVDAPGVLAAVARCFGEHGVSIKSVWQEGGGLAAQLLLITHAAREGALGGTLVALAELDVVRDVASVLRVEGGEV